MRSGRYVRRARASPRREAAEERLRDELGDGEAVAPARRRQDARVAHQEPAARCYVVCVAENDPASIVSYLRARGLTGETVLRRRARNEALSVLRFVRSS